MRFLPSAAGRPARPEPPTAPPSEPSGSCRLNYPSPQQPGPLRCFAQPIHSAACESKIHQHPTNSPPQQQAHPLLVNGLASRDKQTSLLTAASPFSGVSACVTAAVRGCLLALLIFFPSNCLATPGQRSALGHPSSLRSRPHSRRAAFRLTAISALVQSLQPEPTTARPCRAPSDLLLFSRLAGPYTCRLSSSLTAVPSFLNRPLVAPIAATRRLRLDSAVDLGALALRVAAENTRASAVHFCLLWPFLARRGRLVSNRTRSGLCTLFDSSGISFEHAANTMLAVGCLSSEASRPLDPWVRAPRIITPS